MSEIAGHKWSRAMRAVKSDIETGNPEENFLRVLDQFASLRTYSSAAPAVGGYRVLTPKRMTHRAIAQAPTVAARARTRIRWTGSLSVLFVGGLGLAVLAGPANCPCSTAFAVAEQSSMARLGYVQNATMVTARDVCFRRHRAAGADHRHARRAARERGRRVADHDVGVGAVARRADRVARRSIRNQRRPPAGGDRAGRRRHA